VGETITPGQLKKGKACCFFAVCAPCAFLAGSDEGTINVTVVMGGEPGEEAAASYASATPYVDSSSLGYRLGQQAARLNRSAEEASQPLGEFASKAFRWLGLFLGVWCLLSIATTGTAGLIFGVAVVGWGILAKRKQLRTPIEWILKQEAPVWAPRTMFAVGTVMVLIGVSSTAAQKERDMKQQEVALQAKEEAERKEQLRQEHVAQMLEELPAKIHEWRQQLAAVVTAVASPKLEGEPAKKMGDMARRLAAVASELQPDLPTDLLAFNDELVAAQATLAARAKIEAAHAGVGTAEQAALTLVRERQWLEADGAYEQALAALQRCLRPRTGSRPFFHRTSTCRKRRAKLRLPNVA